MPPASETTPWRRSWYPVAYLKDLEPGRPTPFTLLGDDLVLWYDQPASQWRAFADLCPHRLVPLSQGRLNERGELECPYHGWSFDGAGHCTAIPQADAGATIDTPRSRCHAYATVAAQGMLFVLPVIQPKPPPVPCRCCPCWRRSRSSGACRTPSAISPTTP